METKRGMNSEPFTTLATHACRAPRLPGNSVGEQLRKTLMHKLKFLIDVHGCVHLISSATVSGDGGERGAAQSVLRRPGLEIDSTTCMPPGNGTLGSKKLIVPDRMTSDALLSVREWFGSRKQCARSSWASSRSCAAINCDKCLPLCLLRG